MVVPFRTKLQNMESDMQTEKKQEESENKKKEAEEKKKRQEEKLDEDLRQTFPASDPLTHSKTGID